MDKEYGLVKHIVLFSGGVASAVAAFIVANSERKQDVILLHTPTFAEHESADVFREQVAGLLGLPITEQHSGHGLWSLIDDQHCLPSTFIPFCTRVLKQEQTDQFVKALGDDFILYVGFDYGEWRRVQKQSARFKVKGYKSKYPLWDYQIDACQARSFVESWGIPLPDPYKHINHNNCLPCFKGGLGHFWSIWKFYPEYFAKAVNAEERIGHTVFKHASLTELSELWATGVRPKSAREDGIPCLCSV